MKKRILAGAILCVACLLILSACGQGSEKTVASWQEQYDLGVRYLSEGNYEEAIIAFSAAIEIDPKRAPAYVGRGDAYALSGDTEENLAAAQADYERAIELDETNPDAYLGLADIYIRRGEYEKALALLRGALERAKDTQAIAEKIADLEMGNIYDASGKVHKKSVYDADGALEYVYDYSYNEQGFEVKFYCTSYLDEQSDYYAIVEEFDERGYPYRRNYYMADDTSSSTYDILTYNDLKQRTELHKYSVNSDTAEYELISSYKYYYDGSGRRVRYDEYTNDGGLAGYWEYSYDENGVATGEISYSSEGKVRGSITYS